MLFTCNLPCSTKFATVTVIALVALRLSIGWHFYKEGEKKWVDPDFTAAPFLIQAKGPLAPYLQQLVPDFHGWTALLAQPLEAPPADAAGATSRDIALPSEHTVAQPLETPPAGAAVGEEAPIPADKPYKDWAEQVIRDWQVTLTRFSDRYGLDAQQADDAGSALKARVDQLLAYLDGETESICDYRYELFRRHELEASSLATEVPFQDMRIAQKRAETAGMPGVWIDQVRVFEGGLHNDLVGLLTEAQKRRGPLSPPLTLMDLMDQAVMYWVFGVGICLMLGLFTRLAALAGAGFLVMVVATQPPWVKGAEPVYYQVVEMMALLVLATTAVGRWGGLDYYLHALCGACCGKQGKTK